MISHDHNFKNVFLDFPVEALEWILPDIPEKMGKIRNVKFDRQEPGKRRLRDAHFSQDELCTRREIGSDSTGIPRAV